MEIQSSEMSVIMQTRALDQKKPGSEVISKTLDFMNQSKNSLSKSDFDFQKDVLSAATGKGSIINLLA